MQKQIVKLLVICSLLACNTNTINKQPADTTATATPVLPAMDSTAAATRKCYAYTKDKDTIQLQITINGNTFTGNMRYQLFGKDRNNGTLQGSINGDTLIADYHFSSEGMMSLRQIAFLKQQDSLREGFGELVLQDTQYMFKDVHVLQFKGFVLKPVMCN